jgi:GT2 family glycosyltransferase
MKPSPQVAVVVVSYNTKDLLISCLASVVESTPAADTEIIVVDNASHDGSLAAVHQAYPHVVTIANPENMGFGVACNQAIKASTAPLILLLNSDATVTPEAFEALWGAMSANAHCGAAGCRIVDSAGRETINTRNFLTAINQALEQLGMVGWTGWKYLRRNHHPRMDQKQLDCTVDWIDGACLMLRRTALDQAGLFDEAFFMYSEDEDLCFRLKNHGWTICYSASAFATHHGAASTSQDGFEMLRQFYWSQIFFLTKHRGRLSARLYAVAMKIVLWLKSSLLKDGNRRATAREQLRALREAERVNGK